MEFDFCNDDESSTLECPKKQPEHSAVIAAAGRRLEDRAGSLIASMACSTVNPRSRARFSTFDVSWNSYGITHFLNPKFQIASQLGPVRSVVSADPEVQRNIAIIQPLLWLK